MPWLDAGGNAICSTRGRSPGSFPDPCVTELPTATHPTAWTQLTEFKKLTTVTFGLGAIDQLEPFQFSMKPCGRKLPPPPPPNVPEDPTAQHWTAPTQEMLLRIAPTPGLGAGSEVETSVHEEPSQCCISIPDAIPLPSVVAPEAQQSVASTHSSPLRYPPLGLGSVTLGTTDHDVPSQCSIRPWSPAALGKMGRKLGFCCAGPASPTAQQSSAPRHRTVTSWSKVCPVAATGRRDQAVPFHCSARAFRFSPLLSVEYPTATQLDDDVQLTLCRMAPATPLPVGVGLGTVDQADPSQCSASVPTGLPFPPDWLRTVPTAQQSDPLRHETPKNPPPSFAGSGDATRVQAEPFQVSASGLNPPLPLNWMLTPTAQHCRALAHVEPSRTSSRPVPGTVATYQPPGATAPAVGVATPTAPNTAAKRGRATPNRQVRRHGERPNGVGTPRRCP